MSFPLSEKALILKPEAGSRRPEALSWAFAVVLFGILFFMRPELQALRFGAWALGLFFGFSGAVMTLGNWLERNTSMRLNLQEIALVRPLQTLGMKWDEVDRVDVMTKSNARRVFVQGRGVKFSFRPATRVEIRGKIRDEYGFLESEKIIETILTMAKISEIRHDLVNGYYYAKE